jgi:von Willebrand factor type C domain
MMGDFFPSAKDKKVKPDVCSTCTCHNETSVCLKKTCPVLECSPEHQIDNKGECCPSCPLIGAEFVSSTCTYKGVTYQVGSEFPFQLRVEHQSRQNPVTSSFPISQISYFHFSPGETILTRARCHLITFPTVPLGVLH